MFTLDQAKSFVAVAEELHFGRAAERLNMTQPPLSRQIQKLERSIGVDLLRRDNRKVELTAAGRAFLEDAKRLVVAADRAPDNARRIASGHSGELRIGFTAASGFSLLGTLLDTIGDQLPGVHVNLFEMVTGEQVDALQQGDIDLGLARPPFDERIFESSMLLAESLMIAVPTGHRLENLGRDVAMADLRDEPLIMHSPTKARYFYDLIIRHIDIEHGNVVHSVSQVLTMVSLVSARRGIAFVPESTQLLGIDGVSYLPLPELDAASVQMHAIWNRQVTNPALAKLVTSIRAMMH